MKQTGSLTPGKKTPRGCTLSVRHTHSAFVNAARREESGFPGSLLVMPRAGVLALLASVVLMLPYLGASAFSSWRPQANSGPAFLAGCDNDARSFMSEFCDDLDLDEVCGLVGVGNSLFFLDASPCARAALALNQAARMINEDAPAVTCIDTGHPTISGETLGFASDLAASASDATGALNTAASGAQGYTATDVSCAAATTTSAPSMVPTDGPTVSASPSAGPAGSPTASPVQFCHGNADPGICDA